jgi:hypothetical protein
MVCVFQCVFAFLLGSFSLTHHLSSCFLQVRALVENPGRWAITYQWPLDTPGGARSLALRLQGDSLPGSPFTVTVCPARAACCEVMGSGIATCTRGLPASFTVSLRDAQGQIVPGLNVQSLLQASWVGSEGNTGPPLVLTPIDAAVNGQWKFAYTWPADTAPSTRHLSVRLCQGELPRSPFAVAVRTMRHPALETVGVTDAHEFLLRSWIADRSGRACSDHFALVYRATADGFGAAQFHYKCDNVPRLLVVLRSTSGWVFGGYATAAFPMTGGFVADPTCFLYTLINPHGLAPTLLPVRPDGADAVCSGADFGPRYGLNAIVMVDQPNKDPRSHTYFPHSFVDPTGLGPTVFTGGQYFGLFDEILAFAV